MPIVAELASTAQKALRKLWAEKKSTQEPINVVFGISVPTEEAEQEEDSRVKGSLINNNFTPDRFNAMCKLLGNQIKTKQTKQQESIAVEIRPMALVGDSVKRFVLASRSDEKQPNLMPDDYLTKHESTTHITIAASFERHKSEFLAIAEQYREQAKALAEKWKTSSVVTALNNYEVISYQEMLDAPFFGVVYNYIEGLFKQNEDFQIAVLRDAEQFVMRESERHQKNNTSELDAYAKAIVRYYSVLHFLEEATVFVLLGISKKADAFAYPGVELGMYAELKKAENWDKLVTIIRQAESDVEVRQMIWLKMYFKNIKQLAPLERKDSSSSSSSSSSEESEELDQDVNSLNQKGSHAFEDSYSRILAITTVIASKMAKEVSSVTTSQERANLADYTVQLAVQLHKLESDSSSNSSSPTGSPPNSIGTVFPSILSSAPTSPPSKQHKKNSGSSNISVPVPVPVPALPPAPN